MSLTRAFLLLVALAMGASSCSPSPSDIKTLRDETEDGPYELANIVERGRGGLPVQNDAALALVTLTRRGRHVGIPLLASAIEHREPESRRPLVAMLAAELVTGIQSQRGSGADPALPYKDVAYALLTRNVFEGPMRTAVTDALEQWIRNGPFERLDDGAQRYGLIALVKALGTPAIGAFLSMLDDDDRRPRAIEVLLAVGDAPAKQDAARILTRLAGEMREPAWREKKRPSIETANRRARLTPTPDQLDAHLVELQSRELARVVEALKSFD